MRPVSPTDLKDTDLVVSSDRVIRLTRGVQRQGDVVAMLGYDNMTGEMQVGYANVGKPSFVDDPLVRDVRGPRGKVGTIEVELAGVKTYDHQTKWTHRHRVFDAEGNKIADGLGPIDPPARRGVQEPAGPDNERAMAAFTNFLLDDARRYDKVNSGQWVEDPPQYDEQLLRWASEHDDAIQALHDELDPPALELE